VSARLAPIPCLTPGKPRRVCNRLAFLDCVKPDMQNHSPPTATSNLVHLFDESVDVLLSVAQVTTLDVVLEFTGTEATVGVGQLEWPQEVAGLLEVGSDGDDLVDQILHADKAILAEVVLDQLVVGQGNALLVDLAISTLVDEFADGLQVGVAVSDVWVDNGEHLLGGLGQPDEDTIVDLEKTEELEDLARLRGNLVDTLDSDDEDKLGLLLDIEATLLLAQASESDLLALSIAVFLDISLGPLEDDLAFLFVDLLSLLKVRSALFSGLLLALPLLQQSLGDEDLVLRRDRSKRRNGSV